MSEIDNLRREVQEISAQLKRIMSLLETISSNAGYIVAVAEQISGDTDEINKRGMRA